MDLRREPSGVVLRLVGRLDGNSAPEFARVLAEQIEPDCRTLVLETDGLEFVSSAGLRELLVLAKRLQRLKAKAVLAGLPPHVADVLEMTGVTSFYLHAADSTEGLRLCASRDGGFLGRLFPGSSKT